MSFLHLPPATYIKKSSITQISLIQDMFIVRVVDGKSYIVSQNLDVSRLPCLQVTSTNWLNPSMVLLLKKKSKPVPHDYILLADKRVVILNQSDIIDPDYFQKLTLYMCQVADNTWIYPYTIHSYSLFTDHIALSICSENVCVLEPFKTNLEKFLQSTE